MSILFTTILFLPATWMGHLLDKQTNGRLSIGDAQGSFWRGSGFIGVAANSESPVSPLFPGRFAWKVSPLLLLGQVDIEVANSQVFSQPAEIKGNFGQWQVAANSMILPPERLEGLGAPLNTIGPSGKLKLSWMPLALTKSDVGIDVQGKMSLEMSEMASRISPIKPLGSYVLDFNWMGTNADLQLTTKQGPMMLEGKGKMQAGRLQFSGRAFAADGQEDKLSGLLNLLGRRRIEGDKQFIALEFK